MKLRWIAVAGVLFVWFWPGSAAAVTITDSISAFSNTQGQGGWSYGFSNQTLGAGFQQFDTFNLVANRWEASDVQVGGNNNDFLNLNALGGHPTGLGPFPQDAIIWTVRRYMSSMNGFVDIAFDLRKANIVNPAGGGITGRIFVDGAEVFTQFIANTDGIGVQQTITQSVAIGSTIDFVIDPTGIIPTSGSDGQFSARADGAIFSSTISTSTGPPNAIPEPSTFLLLGTGFAGLIGWRLKNSF